MNEPGVTPDSGNGSRSASRICEGQELWSRRSSFSISTCTQIPPARIALNAHPHRSSSPAPEFASPSADFVQSQEYNGLQPPKTPPNKSHHKHSQSLHPGLLSPVSSFTSFKSVFNPPRVPSPLSLSPSPLTRSPRTRPTPLRLLQPFTSVISPATPTPTLATAVASATLPRSSLLFSTDSEEPPRMYHPKPQHPPSPSTSASSNHLVRPTTPHRPPSRSEKLLREALMKDEHERNPMPYTASPYMSNGYPATSPVRGHQRRHSHVPSSREDGTFLVHKPVFNNGLRSPSPSPAPEYHSSLSRRHSQGHGHHPQDQLHYASSPYSLAQSPASASPTRERGHSPLARRSSVKSQSHPARPASPASHSRGYTHSHQSPSYTPSVTSSHQVSPSLSRRQVPRPLPLSPAPEATQFQLPGEPLTMTPHEQVLRARLERVLQANPNLNGRDGDRRRKEGGAEWLIGQAVDVDESTDSDENVVRDENGGRAWRKKHGAVLTPPSSGSNSARSLSKEDMVHLKPQPSAHHQRSRSRTDPAPYSPAAAAASLASPKRSSTMLQSPYMSAKAQYHPHQQHRHHHHTHGGRSGTTPPLVSDTSPATPEEDEEDPEDLRLLTPPPTPPSQGAYHHYAMGKEYMPSPYQTSFGLRRGGVAPPPLGMLRDDERRGRSGYVDSTSEDDDNDEYDEDEESCSCSGCSGSGSCERLSMPHHQLPTNPQMYGNLGMAQGAYPTSRPQFNARRASAKCRQIDGYVSFAAIEGLGAPPEVDSDEEEKKRREENMRKRDGGGVTDWVRWTKKRLLGGGEDQRQPPVPQAHSVVL